MCYITYQKKAKHIQHAYNTCYTTKFCYSLLALVLLNFYSAHSLSSYAAPSLSPGLCLVVLVRPLIWTYHLASSQRVQLAVADWRSEKLEPIPAVFSVSMSHYNLSLALAPLCLAELKKNLHLMNPILK